MKIGFTLLVIFVGAASFLAALAKSKDGPGSFVHWLLILFGCGIAMCGTIGIMLWGTWVFGPWLHEQLYGLGL